MEQFISEILSGSGLVLIGIIGFFLRRMISKIEKDIQNLTDKEKEAATYEYRLTQVEKRLNEHHHKIGAQEVQNTEFKIWLTKIDGKLDQLLNEKK